MKVFLLLYLSPLFARLIIAACNREERSFRLAGWFFGTCQDIAICTLLTGANFIGVPFALLAPLAVYPLADAALFASAGFRMKFSFFRYVLEFKDFTSSAKEMGLIPYTALLLAAYAGLVLAAWHFAAAPAFFPLLFAASFACGLYSKTWRGTMYLYNNILFQELLSWLFPEKPPLPSATSLSLITSACEEATPISPHYPLLRMTHRFVGEKTFHVNIARHEKPHVILIALESMGAKYLSKETTPHMDKMASEGVLFTRFHASGIPTTRSLHATLFGVEPDVDVLSLQELHPLYPLIGIPDLLSANGYHTVYHKGGSLLFLNAVKFLKSHGFQELAGDEEIQRDTQASARTSWGVHDRQLFDYSFRRLQQLAKENRPVFMMICTISNHHPWQVPEGFQAPEFPSSSPLLSRYLQTVYYTDYALGEFMNRLKESGISKNAIVLVTADNGQPMGEHYNNFMPLKGVFEENHHIPLILVADGRIQTPQVIEEIGSQVDLLPTIMDLLSLKGRHHSTGTSLMRKAPKRHSFCVNTHILPYVSYNLDHFKYSIRLDTREEALFNLEKDPGEKMNVIDSEKPYATLLREQLLGHFSALHTLYREHRITSANHQSLAVIRDPSFTDEALVNQVKLKAGIHSMLLSHLPQVTDQGFAAIEQEIGRLEFLYLDNLSISEKGLRVFFGKTRHLKELTLSHMQGISSTAMVQLFEQCPALEEITLSGNMHVDDAVAAAISTYCPNVQNLEIAECHGLTKEGIAALARGLPLLNRLNMLGLTCLDDDTLIALSKGKFSLQALHLLHGSKITSRGLLSLCRANPALQRLSFPGEWIDSNTVIEITKICPALIKLLIHDCRHFEPQAFNAIAKQLQNVVILELAGCPQLTDEFFTHLSNKPLDHLLVAGAPNITNACLADMQKIATLRNILFYHCPRITWDKLVEAGRFMNQNGILHTITYDHKKHTFF